MHAGRVVRFVLVALLGAGAFEAGARALNWFDPTEAKDPYLGFPGTSPLFRPAVDKDGRAIYERSPNKDMYRWAAFDREKAQGEVRVFVVGGSSVQSSAFRSPDGSFPNMLMMYLSAALPGRKVTVVNCGGGGMGSVQNREVLREVLAYQPDLLVAYPEGGEKNLIPPAPAGVLAEGDDASPLRVFVRAHLAPLRIYRALRLLYYGSMPEPGQGSLALQVFSAFVAAAVSRPFAPDTFTRLFEFKDWRPPVLMESPLDRAVIEHAHARFQRNLAAMADMAKDAGVPLIYVLPVRNTRQSFYLRFHVTPEEIKPGRIAEWRLHYETALARKKAGDFAGAVDEFLAVRALYPDDQDEILAFHLGECFERLGRFDDAQREYALPYVRHPMRRQIQDAAAKAGVPVIDPFPALVEISAHGIPSYAEFTDAFHPMPQTNRVIARTVYAEVQRSGVLGAIPPLDAPAMRPADNMVGRLIGLLKTPNANLMLRALLAGDFAEAARLGATIPETELVTTRYTEALYYGWALTRLGQLEKARIVYAKLRAASPNLVDPEGDLLATDEDVIRIAFSGDLFHWF